LGGAVLEGGFELETVAFGADEVEGDEGVGLSLWFGKGLLLGCDLGRDSFLFLIIKFDVGRHALASVPAASQANFPFLFILNDQFEIVDHLLILNPLRLASLLQLIHNLTSYIVPSHTINFLPNNCCIGCFPHLFKID
jgi:hypothetical protein